MTPKTERHKKANIPLVGYSFKKMVASSKVKSGTVAWIIPPSETVI